VYATATTLLLRKFLEIPVDQEPDEQIDLISAVGLGLPAAWAFLANPERYDVDGASGTLQEVRWTVSAHADRMRRGDRVYLWRSGASAGVVAVCTIVDGPALMPPDVADEPFLRDTERLGSPQPRVVLAVDRVLEPPLEKRLIQENSALEEPPVMEARSGTNFSVGRPRTRRFRLIATLAGLHSCGSVMRPP
jgi:hypothetical protein